MKTWNKLSELDGIEVLKVKDQKSDFPEHFHDTFCISYIEQGIEALVIGNNTLYTKKGSISITNPCEIHANPIVQDKISNCFTTIYLSPDVVNYFLNTKDVNFCHQQEIDSHQAQLFANNVSYIKSQNLKEIEKNLVKMLQNFENCDTSSTEIYPNPIQKWEELILYIDHHLETKISLELLAKFMNMDKYNFAKVFRKQYGLSPINFVMMKKIFKMKELISKNINLSQLAYEFEFSDQAHFSKQFKKYIGVSPREYKNQLS